MSHRPRDFQAQSLRGLTKAARILSDIAAPPVLFAALGFALALADRSRQENLLAAAVFAVLICLVPLGIVLYLYKTGRISDMHMSDTNERNLPYLVGVICAVLAFGAASAIGAARPMLGLILCSVLGLTILGLINLRWLISNHTASATMAALVMGFQYGETATLAMTPLVGLIFAARIYLKRHTTLQLIAGILVGLGCAMTVSVLGYF